MRDLRGHDGLQLSASADERASSGVAGGAEALVDHLRAGAFGRAHGKAILVGEHFVVHGGPALAVPIAASLEVRLAYSEDAPRCVGEALALGGITAMVAELGLSSVFSKVSVAIEGALPLGAGLGGSAALAAAFSRALGVDEGLALAAAVHRLERIAHGRPSGLDGMTVSMSAPVWMPAAAERGAGAAAEGPVGVGADAGADPEAGAHGRAGLAEALFGGAWRPVTGLGAAASGGSGGAPVPLTVGVVARHGTTREAVALVAAHRARDPLGFQAMAERTAECAARAREALTQGDWAALGAAMDEAHAPLVELGLVSGAQAGLVAAARAAGAFGAKLSGAGLGGAVIAIGPDGLDLGAVLRQAGAVMVFSEVRASGQGGG